MIKPLTSSRGGDDLSSAPPRVASPLSRSELKGPNPILTTGSGVSLELSGLTINVSYPQQGVSSTPPAVIVTAGSAKIDRCAFNITGGSHPKGSRAIVSDGGVLEVNRSWFQGFDKAIDVVAMNSTPARIQQTMIVSGFGPAQAQSHPPDWYGWGVKLQLGAGRGAKMNEPTTPPNPGALHCRKRGTDRPDEQPSIFSTRGRGEPLRSKG